MVKIRVEKWKMRADIVIPRDQNSIEGKVQIASVPVSLSMALQRSILGQEKIIYVTRRV